MKLDNETISVGDDVFDVSPNRGAGKITNIFLNTGRFEVAFKNKLRVQYDQNGVQSEASHKSLAWHNPFDFIIPIKDPRFKAQQKAIAELVRSTIQVAKGIS